MPETKPGGLLHSGEAAITQIEHDQAHSGKDNAVTFEATDNAAEVGYEHASEKWTAAAWYRWMRDGWATGGKFKW
jgi:hypothetical protein